MVALGQTVPPCSPRGAFTLVEVLVTLVLIGIVLPITLEGISLAGSVAGVARRTTEATSLAEAKLNELVATGQWAMTQSGNFGPDWPDYQWSTQTTQRDTELMELDLQVTWTAQGTQRSLSLSTFVYTGTGSAAATVQ